jgi:hypothetical protein
MTLVPDNSKGTVPDIKISKLRATIAAIEGDLARLPPELVATPPDEPDQAQR